MFKGVLLEQHSLFAPPPVGSKKTALCGAQSGERRISLQ